MNYFEFQKPEFLLALPLAAAYAGLILLRAVLVARDVERFSGAAMERFDLRRALAEAPRREILRGAALALAAASIIVALARPVWGKHPRTLVKEGHDVVFVLDVSNSMSSRDLAPNRLERCKLWIKECLAGFEGHGVGLVVFAGSASIKAPLTTDYDFIRSTLDKVDRWSVAQGGTRLGDALIKTCDKIFSDRNPGLRDVILFTDGGTAEKDLSKAIEAVNGKQVKLIVVGVGDPGRGVRVPSPEGKGYMRYKGKYVTSRLKSGVLRTIIHRCEDGAYIPAGTGNMDLRAIYDRLADRRLAKSEIGERIMVPNEIFQIFIALAAVLLALSASLPPERRSRGNRGGTAPAAAVLVFLAAVSAPFSARSADDAPPKKDGPPDAKPAFSAEKAPAETADGSHPKTVSGDDPAALYNLGNALFRKGDFEAAMERYREALDAMPTPDSGALDAWSGLCARINYNLATASLRRAESLPPVPLLRMPLLEASIAIYRRLLASGKMRSGSARNLEIALTEMERLRKSLKNGRRNSSNGKPGASQDDSDSGDQDSGEPGDEDEDADSKAKPAFRVIDQNNADLPPPTESPKDIMKMEDELAARRRSANKGKQKGVTEMDW